MTAADLRYKLYVSPHIDTLPAVLPVMAATLAASGAPHFKVGAGASGLLRPDKIVVYLRDSAELTEVSMGPARYALARLGADGVTLPSFAPTSLGRSR